MSINKILVYFLILIFAMALFATLPRETKDYSLKTGIGFKKISQEKITKAERDPFRYKTKSTVGADKTWKPSSVTVKGIIWDEKNPSAVISIDGGKTIFVKEGDKINHIRILKIERDKIIIDEYGKRTLNFK
jgi:type II secretory pathway component PulC